MRIAASKIASARQLLPSGSHFPALLQSLDCPSPSSAGEFLLNGSLISARYASSLPVKAGQYYISKGTGGRSSVSGIIATVFGATGFLGRYVVQQLAKIGSQILVPYRGSEDSPRHLKLMGDLGQIVPMRYNPRDEGTIKGALAKSNVVVNLLGRDYETRNFSFEDVHISIPECLSRLSREHGGIIKYIQVSCLGASPLSPSKLLRTKAQGDTMALLNFPEATILRPAPIVGTEDRLLNRLAMQARKFPFLPLIGGGSAKLQPVHVVDVAAAVIATVRDDGSSMGKIYELGGPDVFTIKELAHLMFDTIREHPRILSIPIGVAKVLASPLTYPRDYIDQLLLDYLVSPDALSFKELGITPLKMQGVAIEHLYAYRTGGPSAGTTMGEQIAGPGF